MKKIKIKIKDTNTSPSVSNKKRQKDFSCSFCPPNKGANASKKPKRGVKKPKKKDKRK